MEEYLTVEELCQKTKYARQSVYNMISKNVFILNRHYVKPTPKKILFKNSAIEAWLAGDDDQAIKPTDCKVNHPLIPKQKGLLGCINI